MTGSATYQCDCASGFQGQFCQGMRQSWTSKSCYISFSEAHYTNTVNNMNTSQKLSLKTEHKQITGSNWHNKNNISKTKEIFVKPSIMYIQQNFLIPDQVGAVTPCSGVSCLNGGQCVFSGVNFQCQCPSGFSGTYCEVGQCY